MNLVQVDITKYTVNMR